MDDDSSIASYSSTTSSVNLRQSLYSVRNHLAEFTNMEVDYDLDQDQLAHAGKTREEHLTFVETYQAKQETVKDIVAGKVGALKQEQKEIAAAQEEVNSIHAEYQEKLVEPEARLKELKDKHCMYQVHCAELCCFVLYLTFFNFQCARSRKTSSSVKMSIMKNSSRGFPVLSCTRNLLASRRGP